jgi:SAM-dependent methyltransferase
MALYDSIGRAYTSTRRPDPRIAAAIAGALGDVDSVVNIGAGAGSYEPRQTVAAIEPSRVMIAQRSPGSAPALHSVAEHIPLRDRCVDAALAVLTVHHWNDVAAGIAQMRRVARRRLVIFSWQPRAFASFWLLSEYLPEAARVDSAQAEPIAVMSRLLRGAEVRPVPVPMTARMASRQRTGAGLKLISTRPSVQGCPSLPGQIRAGCELVSAAWLTIFAPDAGTTTTPTCCGSAPSTSATAS